MNFCNRDRIVAAKQRLEAALAEDAVMRDPGILQLHREIAEKRDELIQLEKDLAELELNKDHVVQPTAEEEGEAAVADSDKEPTDGSAEVFQTPMTPMEDNPGADGIPPNKSPPQPTPQQPPGVDLMPWQERPGEELEDDEGEEVVEQENEGAEEENEGTEQENEDAEQENEVAEQGSKIAEQEDEAAEKENEEVVHSSMSPPEQQQQQPEDRTAEAEQNLDLASTASKRTKRTLEATQASQNPVETPKTRAIMSGDGDNNNCSGQFLMGGAFEGAAGNGFFGGGGGGGGGGFGGLFFAADGSQGEKESTEAFGNFFHGGNGERSKSSDFFGSFSFGVNNKEGNKGNSDGDRFFF